MKIMLSVIALCVGIYLLIPQDSLLDTLLVVVLSVISVACTVLVFMDKVKKNNLKIIIIKKIKKVDF